jgi:hypothetical protein
MDRTLASFEELNQTSLSWVKNQKPSDLMSVLNGLSRAAEIFANILDGAQNAEASSILSLVLIRIARTGAEKTSKPRLLLCELKRLSKNYSSQYLNDAYDRLVKAETKHLLFRMKRFYQYDLVVDSLHYKIELPSSKKNFISREISKAITLLVRKKTVSFDEFLREVFQFSFYDSDTHRQKIYNFLNKLKKCLPKDLKILTRYENVYLQGTLDKVLILEVDELEQLIEAHPCWDKLSDILLKEVRLEPFAKIEKAIQIFRNQRGQKLTRKYFQDRIGSSKSEVHRILVEMQKRGLVIKEGRGKSTIYIASVQL